MRAGKTVPELTAETPPIVGTDEVVVYRSPGPLKRATTADVRTYMQSNLGTMATQDANAVAITGGSITGITDLAVADGGTGASNASDARTNLGVAIGTDVQAFNLNLASLSGLTLSADQLLYATGANTLAQSPITSFGRSLVDDADASAARTTLGVVIGTDVQAYDADLQAIAALTSAADKMPYATGAGTWALADLTSFARTLNASANQAAFLAALGQIDTVETDFVQAGTGATAVTGQAKLRQAPVQPNSGEFGAFTDATVTTATLLAAFTAAMADGRPIELSGHYDINGPITPVVAVDGAELHLIVRDDVTITVDGAATVFWRIFYAESTTVRSHSITGGGTLTIDGNNRCGVGIWLRHTAASTGGVANIAAPVTVRNLTAPAANDNGSGILVIGRFSRVIMRSPTVEDVTRAGSGETSGLSVSGFDGEVELYSPVVRRILSGAETIDADGIKCFGRAIGTANNRRGGSVRIYDPVFEDCKGRSYKDQCGDTVLYRPRVKRNGAVVVCNPQSVEFDFQSGGGIVLDAELEYSASGATSPLSTSHTVFSFQQTVDNSPMYAACRNTTIISDVIVTRFALHTDVAGSLASVTEIDGVTLIPKNGFATNMLGRGVFEFDAASVLAKSAETVFSVRNVQGSITFPVIGYTSYAHAATGTATAGSSTTLTDSTKSFSTDQYAGFLVRITGGTGAGQTRTITSNTATALTVPTWTVTPDATSTYAISGSLASKLSIAVDNCATTLGVAGSATRAFAALSGQNISDLKSFEIGNNPGFRNYYQHMIICPKRIRAGTKLVLELASTSFVDSDFVTPVTVPWGTSGTLYLEGHGISNVTSASNDAILNAYLNNATATPSVWFTQNGGVNWGAVK